jgi:hypothetical protein
MEIHRLTQSDLMAAEEDKVDRQDMMERVAPAAVAIPNQSPDTDFSSTLETVTGKKEVMGSR